MIRHSDILNECSNILDYAEFSKLASEKELPGLRKREWSQKVGMWLVAQHENPSLSGVDAYVKLLKDLADRDIKEALLPVEILPVTACGGCGGGKIV